LKLYTCLYTTYKKVVVIEEIVWMEDLYGHLWGSFLVGCLPQLQLLEKTEKAESLEAVEKPHKAETA